MIEARHFGFTMSQVTPFLQSHKASRIRSALQTGSFVPRARTQGSPQQLIYIYIYVYSFISVFLHVFIDLFIDY